QAAVRQEDTRLVLEVWKLPLRWDAIAALVADDEEREVRPRLAPRDDRVDEFGHDVRRDPAVDDSRPARVLDVDQRLGIVDPATPDDLDRRLDLPRRELGLKPLQGLLGADADAAAADADGEARDGQALLRGHRGLCLRQKGVVLRGHAGAPNRSPITRSSMA